MRPMKILIFSWRDIQNPKSGGAEILTQELAKRWVAKGHQVTLITSLFPTAKSQQTINRIRIYRTSLFNNYSPVSYILYLLSTIRFYRRFLRGYYDVIVDQVHGLPLFTPLYAKEPVVLFPLEVAGNIWRYEIPFPYWIVGWFLEFIYIKLFQHRPFLTISRSTAQNLKQWGVKKVKVINPGINVQPLSQLTSKTFFPSIISLSRLTPMKRINHIIRAFKIVLKDYPRAKLFIVGRGQIKYINQLKTDVRRYKMQKQVIFTGFVNEKQKQKLLSQAWVLVSTSLREGWGLNIIEAAACGTPSIVYRVPGLVDSVKNNQTGIICQQNSPENLAKNIIKLLANQSLRQQLSSKALDYSRSFSWDKAANESLIQLEKLISP